MPIVVIDLVEFAFSRSTIARMLPPWSLTLSNLYWRLRATRSFGRPSRSTWYRRISAEKKRLLSSGVDRFELHQVCIYLGRRNHSRASVKAFRRLLDRLPKPP